MKPEADEELLLGFDDDGVGDPVLDWAAVFGNPNPVEIEIGIGKGRFLIDAAQRRPGTNFVGIEWANKYLRLCQARCRRRRLANVRLARADARELVEFFCASSSVRAFHLYFPDPWPKKRHHKRRLFDAEFVVEATRALVDDGLFWIATDHDEYFAAMLEVLRDQEVLQPIEMAWEGAPTNYEDKFRSRGKEIHRLCLRKQAILGTEAAE
ncbi:MAG: tRNA (guanosine(46)-N7)-methyltransferase TrmB [Gemmatimonadota bacterium]